MTGDIILQKRSGIVGWFVSRFTGSDYVHVGIDIGDGFVVHVDFWGKHETLISDWGDDLIVLTPVPALTEQGKQYLKQCCHKERVQGYSIWHAIKSWFHKCPDDEKPMGTRYHCSGFVSAMYRKLGFDLVPNRSDETTQPQDFLGSVYLRRKF
jgi:cell wall-associated NlpC family hydrolase